MFSSESLHSISTGGLGVHVTELAADLQRRGYDIYVITRRKEDQNYYDCIDGMVDPAEVKSRYGIAPMVPTIFSPGRMTLQKGMDMLVEAVPMVLASFPDSQIES